MQSFDGECWEADTDEGRREPAIVTANQVLGAQTESAEKDERLQNARLRLGGIRERHKQLIYRLSKYERIRQARQFCDDWFTRAGGLVVAVSVVSGITVILCLLVGLPSIFWIITLLALLSPTSILGAKLFKPADTALVSQIDAWKRDLRSLQDQQEVTEAEVAKTNHAFNISYANHQNILNQFNSRINRLRSMNWGILQGVPFEQFLALIFVEWDYHVETTKVTGDQGVDLIVSKTGLRVAVQAKGYPGSTVGNSAVQEAHTGMKFYGCQRCAVITNSTFTSAARKLAEGVGCILIEHDMIPLLIEGKIKL
jgi:hypothetical protein